MGWNPFKKWFGTSRKAKNAQAEAAAEAAKARRIAEAALTPTEDSDQARSAAERRLRRLASARGLASTAGNGTRGFGTSALMGQ